MATLVNLIQVPSLIGTSTIPVNIPNSGAHPRTPTPMPQNIAGSGTSDPIGPQRWPTKL